MSRHCLGSAAGVATEHANCKTTWAIQDSAHVRALVLLNYCWYSGQDFAA